MRAALEAGLWGVGYWQGCKPRTAWRELVLVRAASKSFVPGESPIHVQLKTNVQKLVEYHWRGVKKSAMTKSPITQQLIKSLIKYSFPLSPRSQPDLPTMFSWQ